MHGIPALRPVASAGVKFGRLAGLCIAVLITMCAWGEFRPYQAADFEDGRAPDSIDPFGVDIQSTLRVANWSLLSNAPQGFREETAARVTGKYGAGIQSNPNPDDRSTHQRGFSIGVMLDRDKLGATGRALYQADFFFPPTNVPEQAPCIAILALDPTAAGNAPAGLTSSPMSALPKSFYRFGISRRKAATLYFSCVIPNAETAPIYEQDSKLYGVIPRPGWHRFAMLFTGPEEIRCYLDGKEPRFSPIKDPRLRKLKLGVMLADAMQKYECYVDNLTILWSMDNSELPVSPFAPSWANVTMPTPGTAPPAAPATAMLTPAATMLTPAATVIAQAAPPATGAASNQMPSLPAPPPMTPPPLPPAPTSVPQVSAPPSLPSVSTALVWLDPASAWADAQKTRRNFLLFFFSPTDSASAGLDGLLDESPAAKAFVQSCSKTKIDITQQQGLNIARGYKLKAVPTMIVFSPDGEELGRAVFSPRDSWEVFAARLGVR